MEATTGLVALNFFMADVQGGLGPFLATWLASTGWQPERVGLVMTIGGLVGLAFNAPAGALVDRTARPRFWIAVASLTIVAGTLGLLPARGFASVLAAQIASALGGALVLPAMISLALGIVGKERFPRQQGHNEAWNHAGNVVAAGLIAAATYAIGATSAFWILAGMAGCSAATLLMIPARAIDMQRATGRAASQGRVPIGQMIGNGRLLALGFALLLFHLGNAAMLPLLGQRMAAIGHGDATRWMAACVVVAQLTMVPVAICAGLVADRIDRVWLLLFACCILPVRGIVAAVAHDPMWLVPIQMMDACGAGTLGVAVPILAADVTWGTGRTQSALGFLAMMQGIGASLSNTLGGVLVAWFGWSSGFLGLAFPALFAFGLALRLDRGGIIRRSPCA